LARRLGQQALFLIRERRRSPLQRKCSVSGSVISTKYLAREGKVMASNFEIAVDKNNDVYILKLIGDFDATSAYELIYAIKKLPPKTAKISIHTNGLKKIYPFGIDVFRRISQSLNGQSAKIVFTGQGVSRFERGNAGTTS
jgi:anti-anti-sigma regulatory factor